QDGSIWSESFGKVSYLSLDQESAKRLCESLGATLPTIKLLLEAEDKHFRDVIPGIGGPAYTEWYWSSSVDPYATGELPGGDHIGCHGGALLGGVVSPSYLGGVACDNPEHSYYLAVCVAR